MLATRLSHPHTATMMSHTGSEWSPLSAADGWRQLAAFALAAFGWTWGIAAVLSVWKPEAGAAEGLLFGVAVFGPSVTGVALTAHFQGRSGLTELRRRATRWRVDACWYAVVLLVLPILILVAAAVHSAQTGHALLAAAPSIWPLIVLAALALGPLGEELGWRGFALPRLLALMPPLPASVVLGAVWGAWHWPAFWLGVPPFDVISPVAHLIGAVLISIVITGIYMGTGRSVLVSGILVHTVVNASMAILHVSLWTLVAAEALLALVVVIVTGPAWWARRATRPVAAVPVGASAR